MKYKNTMGGKGGRTVTDKGTLLLAITTVSKYKAHSKANKQDRI